MKNFNNFFGIKAMLVGVVFFTLTVVLVSEALGQTYNHSNTTSTTCSGTFYDHAGSSNYSNNQNITQVFYPSTAGNTVRVTFTSFNTQSGSDFLYIYNGNSTSAPLIGTYSGNTSPGTITSTAADGSLSFRFTSDGTVTRSGWVSTISCVVPDMMVPASGNNSYTVCSGDLYDAGGSAGNYSDNLNGYTVLYPATVGTLMQVSGTTAGETCCDYLRIYDGVGTSGTLLWTGVAGSGTVPVTTSSSGPLTIQFTSDGSVTGAGFDLDLSCYTPPVCSSCPTYNFGVYTPTTIPATHSSSTSVAAGCKWYAFNVTTGLEYVFSTCSNGGSYSGDSRMILYNSSCSEIANVDDYCGLGPQITYTATYTGVVYLRLAHYSNSAPVSWTISYWQTPPPGENCSNPQNLANLTSPYSATTVGYADDIATCRTGGPDRIFFINVPAFYTLNIGETSNSYDEWEYLGYGSNCSSTTQIYCWDNDGLSQMSWTNNTGSDQTVWYIQDAYSGGCGSFTLQWALIPPPDYSTNWISMNTGSTEWCAGETRNVTVTVENSGALAWADTNVSDFNIGIKWNGDPDYLVRVDAQNLAPGATTTYTFSVTAPLTPGSNNLSFDIVREGCFWFANNSTACGCTAGPGNTVYTSVPQTIKATPTAVSAGTDATICNGSSSALSGTAAATGSTTFSFTASGYDGGVAYSLGDFVEGITSGLPTDAIITSISYSTSILTGSTNYCGSWWGAYLYINGSSYSSACNVSNQSYNGLNGQPANNQTFRLWVYDIDNWDDAVNLALNITINYSFSPTYSWTPAASLSASNISNPVANPTSTTVYTMTVVANGCEESDDVTINVVNQPSVGTMTISESSICEGETVTISNSASNGTIYYWASSEGGYPCNWDIINQGFGGSSSFNYSFASNPNISACETDPYRIHVYSAAYNSTCGWSWNYGSGSSQYLNVYPAPTWGDISPEDGNDICLLDGVSIDAEINNPDPSSTITWRRKPSSGTVWTNGLPNNSLDYPSSNQYDYQPIYSTTISGCELSSPAPITVQVFDNGGWTGIVSSDWHNAANWCGGIPDSGTAVSISPLAYNEPIISSGTANVCDITINPGSQLSLEGSQNLNVYCNFTNNGAFISGTANETLVFLGTSSSILSGNDNINNLTIASGASLQINDDLNVLGNWTNDGSFDQNLNAINFIGAQTQYIKTGVSSFVDISISNITVGDSAIVLSDNLNITDKLTLNNGIVNTNGNRIIFGSASLVTVNSTSSFINGKMQRTGSGSFTFPAGHVNTRDLDGNSTPENYTVYSPISITPSANATVEVEYIFDNAGMPDWWEHSGNMDATLHHVSDREYWYLNSDQNLSEVTLFWYNNGHTVGNICTHGFDNGNPADFVASDLTVAYWSGTQWVDAGGTMTGDHDYGFITSGNSINFGAKAPRYITFGSKNNLNPLPVELTMFRGECIEGETTLFWQTASETNNSHFIVQVSDNMKDFNNIEWIEGAGNSSSINDYSIKFQTSNELQYYRLIQTDYDGKTKIYPPISIICKDIQSEPIISVYPNPFDSEFDIILEHLNNITAKIEIINSLGQIISESEIEINNGFAREHYDLSSVKPGMYQLRVISGETVLSSKVIKR